MDESNSLRHVQKLFKKTLYSAKTPVSTIRERYDAFFYAPYIPNNTDVTRTLMASVPVEVLKPEVSAANRVILYAHGGSFLSGSCKASRNFCASFAHECACTLFLPEYRLAPEYPFPAALEDMVLVYKKMLQTNIPSRSIILAGNEAGAALVTALIHYLKGKKLPQPAALILISPWLDLSCSSKAVHDIQKFDTFLLKDALQEASRRYTSADKIHNPLVSPLYGSFEAFPPTFIQCGGTEILLADARALAQKLEAASGTVTLDVWPNMWHFFQAMDGQAKEAHMAVEKIAQWVASLFSGQTE